MAKPRKIRSPESGGETLNALSDWWQGNGKLIILGLVGVSVGAVSWSAWQYSREQHALSAAEGYVAFVKRVEDKKDIGKVVGIPELPTQEYDDTAYLSFAYLRRAKFFIENEDYEKAIADLRWTGKNSVSLYLSELAYVRLARVLVVLRRSDEALKILDENEFSTASLSLVEDARGDVLLSLEDFEGGLKAYRTAWEAASPKPDFLRVKLELLGQKPELFGQAPDTR